MILMVLQDRMPLPMPKEAMHDLLEEETTANVTKQLWDISMGATLLTQCVGYHGHGSGGCGRRSGHSGNSGTGDSHNRKCTHCQIVSHTTDAGRKWECALEGGNNNNRICFQYGLPEYVKLNWVSYKRYKVWWKVKKPTPTAALITTRDCDPFWLTTCAHAATADSKWVISSVASHYMCDNCSSISTFQKLSLPVIIELGDHNSVTTMHYGFIDII